MNNNIGPSKAIYKAIGVIAISTILLVGVACQPPPPAKVCDYITAEENGRVEKGMTLWDVKQTLNRQLKPTSTYIGYSGVFSTYSWEQDYDINGCYQSVDYHFKDDVMTRSSWQEVVK